MSTTKKEAPAAKHTHYVSLENGVIYPAMTSPAGYEDEHPSEYRPATQEEVDAYKSGADTTRPYARAQVELSSEAAVPRAIRLEDEPSEAAPAAPLVPPPPAFVVPPSAE